MKSISGRRLIKILEMRGWKQVRVNGSHHVYVKDGNFIRISIPVHGNEDLKIGLLRHFMKIAGITESEL